MIWMYERGAQMLRIETRFDNDSSEFELIWVQPDGTMTSERFPTEEAFRVRLERAEATLESEQWQRAGPPEIMRAGWKV